MSDILNTIVYDNYNNPHRLQREIARGGQGAIYLTQDPTILIKLALKDGEPIQDDSQNYLYEQLKTSPIPPNLNLTLPIAVLKGMQGFVMQLLDEMITFGDFFQNKAKLTKTTAWLETIEEPTIKRKLLDYYNTGASRKRLLAYLKSGTILAELHANGLVYSDYSDNNAFISANPKYTNIWLIDCDNLDTEQKRSKDYVYTPELAAPEIIRFADEYCNPELEDRWGSGNTFASDTYTYAKCLFAELLQNHVFKGALYYDKEAEAQTPGEATALLDNGSLPYIYDPDDQSNQGGFFPIEAVVTEELQALFAEIFSEQGRFYKEYRPTMFNFIAEVAKNHDLLLRCDNCGMDYLATHEQCPWCDSALPKQIKLRSFYYEGDSKGKLIWKYYHELEENTTLAVPLRLIHGMRAKEVDVTLFSIFFTNGKAKLTLTSQVDVKLWFSLDGVNYQPTQAISDLTGKFYLRIQEREDCYYLEGMIL